MTAPPPPNDTSAVRLMFAYDGRRVSLKSAQPVTMRVPASDRIDESTNRSGTWIEVRDFRDRVLYRKVLHDPMPTTLEVPSGDPVRTFTRVPAPKSSGVFSVVIPEPAQGATLVLWASPADAPAQAAEAIGKFELSRPRDNEPR